MPEVSSIIFYGPPDLLPTAHACVLSFFSRAPDRLSSLAGFGSRRRRRAAAGGGRGGGGRRGRGGRGPATAGGAPAAAGEAAPGDTCGGAERGGRRETGRVTESAACGDRAGGRMGKQQIH